MREIYTIQFELKIDVTLILKVSYTKESLNIFLHRQGLFETYFSIIKRNSFQNILLGRF